MFLTWKRFTALSYTMSTTHSSTNLADAATAMSASDGVDMTSSLLGTSVVSTNR